MELVITIPEALLGQSRVTTRLTVSPAPFMANNTTANHHAHILRCRKPRAAANVAPASKSNSTPASLPIGRKPAAAGLLRSHNRSSSALGKRSEEATTAAIAVAANRKAATIGTALGLCSIALSSFGVK